MRPLLMLLLAAASAPAAAPPAPWKLTAEDRRFLDGLFTFIIDPTGAERVEAPVLQAERWRPRLKAVTRPVWRLAGGPGRPSRLLGADGGEFILRGGVKRHDFVAECRARVAAEEGPGGEEIAFARMRRGDLDEIVIAAWLHRLGQEPLAARYLASVDRDEALRSLRRSLALQRREAMVWAFVTGADEAARSHAERLVRHYPDELASSEAPAILADLKRRAGRPPRTFPPPGFSRWAVANRIKHLIESLEDIERLPELYRNFWLPLRFDPRAAALIEIGDEAVPALLDAVEKDTRLARAWGHSREMSTFPPVLTVREAALAALLRIWKADRYLGECIPPGVIGLPTKEEHQEAVRRLRAYWRQMNGLPIERRMLAHLADPKADGNAWREAAYNLGNCVEEWKKETPRRRPSPLFALDRPTAAEAILATMDRDLALQKADEDDERFDRSASARSYLDDLARLRDPRSLVLLHRRIHTAGEERYELMLACLALGSTGPVLAFARAFEKEGIILPPGKAGEKALGRAVGLLIRARLPECERALVAGTSPRHPLGPTIRARIRAWAKSHGDDVWSRHPFFVPVLEAALSDRTHADAIARREGRGVATETSGRISYRRLPEGFPTILKMAQQRWCDLAAEALADNIAGLPFYTRLATDADNRLDAIKAFVARFKGRLRPSTEEERRTLAFHSLVPDIRPLGRAATEADVKAGRAVFHLGGKGKPITLKSPAAAEVDGESGLIVQAEAGPDGKAVYGVIFQTAIRRVDAKEIERITPLTE